MKKSLIVILSATATTAALVGVVWAQRAEWNISERHVSSGPKASGQGALVESALEKNTLAAQLKWVPLLACPAVHWEFSEKTLLDKPAVAPESHASDLFNGLLAQRGYGGGPNGYSSDGYVDLLGGSYSSGRGRGRLGGGLTGRQGVPEWTNDPEFDEDVFTFVRVQYSSYSGRGYSGRARSGFGWSTDWPASDLNFSFRLQQLTSMKVNPEAIYLRLTDPDLFKYPFIYVVEPGRMVFEDDEVPILRRYLLNGGFLMVDDFWGENEWYNFYYEIRRVFPDRQPVELPLEHPIFHCVYDLKEKPQIPSIDQAWGGRTSGRTWERSDAQTPHYKAIFDDDDRMMVIICHNTDLGDGWEREGEDSWYFEQFSEKYAYPLGINIVVYAMTH